MCDTACDSIELEMAMTMAHADGARRGARRTRRNKHSFLALPVLMLMAGIVLALAVIAWLLWPRWPAPNVPVDAPGVRRTAGPGSVRRRWRTARSSWRVPCTGRRASWPPRRAGCVRCAGDWTSERFKSHLIGAPGC